MPEKIIIDGFNHFGGKHCETTAMRNVLAYHGFDVSEEMLLGLGGGVGFIYWYMKLMQAPLIGTRTGGKDNLFLKNICRRIGAGVEILETNSESRGYRNLIAQLKKGEPAIVHGDMAYLPYLALPEGVHFGGHMFVVYGIDESKDIIYISDRSQNPLFVRVNDLAAARGSKHPPFPPKHRLLAISYQSALEIKEGDILNSIYECCSSMLNPPISNIGIAGIRKWAGLVTKWPEQFSGLSLYGCLMNTYMYIEIGGTGGSGFRGMYAAFLDESADITGRKDLAEAAGLFRDCAAKWSAVARCSMPDSDPILGQARKLILKKNKLFEEKGSEGFREMLAINKNLDELQKQVESGYKIKAEVFKDLQNEILECAELELKAFTSIRAF